MPGSWPLLISQSSIIEVAKSYPGTISPDTKSMAAFESERPVLPLAWSDVFLTMSYAEMTLSIGSL